jgi:hypothetical protein
MVHKRRIGKDAEGSGNGQIGNTTSAFVWKDEKSLEHDSLFEDRDLNPEPSEYKSEALSAKPACSVKRQCLFVEVYSYDISRNR